ncbi:MAG: hypothetical protein BWY55_00617 [archaeon ADurb.Bin336]|nr:MAG: hypothetical protein BWY55_00617 [archaeon ADurb.Bin336]
MPKFNLFESQDLFELYYLILTWSKDEDCREKNIIKELNLIRKKDKRKPIKQTTLNNQLRFLRKKIFIQNKNGKLGNGYFGPHVHQTFKYYFVNIRTKNKVLNYLLKQNKTPTPQDILFKIKKIEDNMWEDGILEEYISAKQLISFNLFRLFNFFLKNNLPDIKQKQRLTFKSLKIYFEHFLLINWQPIHKQLLKQESKEWIDIFEKIFISTEPHFKKLILTEYQLKKIQTEELK